VAASKRLDWPLHVVDHAGHVPHIEQPESFVHRLTDILKVDSTATVGFSEAVG
jgi:pimeloyl-ACP methyl ester carboxylesterase